MAPHLHKSENKTCARIENKSQKIRLAPELIILKKKYVPCTVFYPVRKLKLPGIRLGYNVLFLLYKETESMCLCFIIYSKHIHSLR